MKQFLILFLFTLFTFNNTFSQKTIELVESITPNSLSIQGAALHYLGPKKPLILELTEGATVFNTKNSLILIDPVTYEEKSRIKFPKIKEGEIVYIRRKSILDLKDNFVLFSKKTEAKTGITNLYCTKISESFTVNPIPEKVVQMKTNESALDYNLSNDKSLILLTDQFNDLKEKRAVLYYHLLDNNLKILISDSAISSINNPDTINTFMVENGFAIVKQNGLKREIILYNNNNKEFLKFLLNGVKKNQVVSNMKQIGDNIILCGNYYSYPEKKRVTNGIFKMVYSLKAKQIIEEIYFDHVPKGSHEFEELPKSVDESCITENGTCIVVILQKTGGGIGGGGMGNFAYNSAGNFASTGNGNYYGRKSYKYEIMCITNTGSKWSKQIPVTGISKIYCLNNSVIFSCIGNDRYDFNNFTYENPLIVKKNLYALEIDTYHRFIKINLDGSIIVPKQSDTEQKYTWLKVERFKGGVKTKKIDFEVTTITE